MLTVAEADLPKLSVFTVTKWIPLSPKKISFTNLNRNQHKNRKRDLSRGRCS